jgi:hypothetical protein
MDKYTQHELSRVHAACVRVHAACVRVHAACVRVHAACVRVHAARVRVNAARVRVNAACVRVNAVGPCQRCVFKYVHAARILFSDELPEVRSKGLLKLARVC